ncbi:MAG: YIP1 family protein [Deltaproteobacteria bacterium]|nr:YIP1 family protein [Deltaproteobacteria bacterium]
MAKPPRDDPPSTIVVDDDPPPRAPERRPSVAVQKKDAADTHPKLFFRFLRRSVAVTLRPRAFWRRLAEQGAPSFGELMWPHTTILSALGGVAALVGGVANDRSAGVVAAHAILTFVASVIMVVGFGFIARVVSGAEKGSAKMGVAFAFGVYGMTPMLLLGVLHVVPSPLVHTIAGLLALPYTFYVVGLGVGPMLAVPDKRGAETAGLLCAAALLAWSLTSALAAIPLASEATPTPPPVTAPVGTPPAPAPTTTGGIR